jgi:hypothetical protein
MFAPPLLAPVTLIGRFRFENVEARQRLGRDVLAARARLRQISGRRDELVFDFEFDEVTGVVLCRTISEGTKRVEVTEAVTAHFDDPINSERFVFTPPVGSETE